MSNYILPENERYDLNWVKSLIDIEEISFERDSARDAMDDFGLTTNMVKNLLKRLNKDQYKHSLNAEDRSIAGTRLDVYKIRLRSTYLYIKFFIEDDELVVVWSCHKDREQNE